MAAVIAFLASGVSVWDRLAQWYRDSLICELLEWLRDRFFTVEFDAYENFSLSASAGATLRNVVVGLAIGIVIAACMISVLRYRLGRFVRALLRAGATSPDTAVTLLELGFFHDVSVRSELSRGANLPKIVAVALDASASGGEEIPAERAAKAIGAGAVSCVDAAATDAENGAVPAEKSAAESAENIEITHDVLQNSRISLDFAVARFYIPEELKYRAENRYDKRGSGVLSVLLTLLLSVLLAALLCRFLPSLVGFADNLISLASPK